MDSDKVVGPILLQRQCDGGKADMSPEEWANIIAARLKNSRSYFPGCGTVFQYYWGSGAMCPTCGRSYLTDMESLKRYRVEQEKTCQT